MTSNIIDKSLFFRRRAKPTEAENYDRYTYLLEELISLLQEFMASKEYTPEQRVRIMTHVFDYACCEIKVKKGLD